jgi:hypothetical protein
MHYKVNMYISLEKPLRCVCRHKYLTRPTHWRDPVDTVNSSVYDRDGKLTDFVDKLTFYRILFAHDTLYLLSFQFSFHMRRNL